VGTSRAKFSKYTLGNHIRDQLIRTVSYEGLFAWHPDRVEDGISGRTETHDHTFGRIEKDW
jgi:hypothetical protein